MFYSREELRKRELPYMTLSSASNPLTAPVLVDPGSSATERAIRRFAVEGTAIVTGGAGALGLETARALLEHGSPGICLFDVHPSLASSQPAIEALRCDFPASQILVEIVDVTNEKMVQEAVKQSAEALGSIDILLCFAGIVGCAHATDVSSTDWKRILDVNTTGSWLCAQAVGRQMIQQAKGGSIVFTASVSAHRVNFPQPQVAYNVSKAALLQLKSSLAAEWAQHGIRVNSISPGYMDTMLNAGKSLESTRQIWAARNPMGRMGDPTELAGVVVLLCSAGGRYINGADIVVDGGGTVF